MLGRMYGLVWLLVAGTAAVLYLTGYFNEQALVVVGFLTATLAFMGIVAVLPWWVDKKFAPRY